MNIEKYADDILNGLTPGDWSANKSHVTSVLKNFQLEKALASMEPLVMEIKNEPLQNHVTLTLERYDEFKKVETDHKAMTEKIAMMGDKINRASLAISHLFQAALNPRMGTDPSHILDELGIEIAHHSKLRGTVELGDVIINDK